MVSLKQTELKATVCLHLLFRDNDITGVLDHTFCVEHNAYGEIIQHELKPNGKTISVSEDTKKEYVRYVGRRVMYKSIHDLPRLWELGAHFCFHAHVSPVGCM